MKKKLLRLLNKNTMLVMPFFSAFLLLLTMSSLFANQRYNDPDGCFSCHGLSGLQYIDKNGVLRDASIDQSHYYSSLHGSVPCKDCHRNIRYYPHIEENAEVDCADSCHVNEPSSGEAFSHKEVVKEFLDSAHGSGDSKGFTGANRFTEDDRSQSPSCRRCHSNSAYIEAFQIEKFKEAFQHTDTECGNCHQGEAWRNQLGGHILRRFIGARWKKQDSNKVCNDCHADLQEMQKVSLKDPINGEKIASDYRWQHASASYTKSLHSRILVNGDESGASCLDCHAPNGKGYRHGIENAQKSHSPTHMDNLSQTCGQSKCHKFSKDAKNFRFVSSDQHNLERLPFSDLSLAALIEPERLQSNWYKAFLVLGFIALIFILGQFIQFVIRRKTSVVEPIIGTHRFKNHMLGRRKRVKPKDKKMANKNSK
ncbi:MAG: hypothetical protein QM479_14900 [Pseudomonadota bacterium]